MGDRERKRRDARWAWRVLQAGITLLALASVCLVSSAAPPANVYAALADAPPPLLRLEGALNAKGSDKWVVGDTPVLIGARTEIIEKRGLAELGAWIVVWAGLRADGAFEAQIVYVDTPADKPSPTVELSGVLTKRGQEWWVVERMLVHIAPDTTVRGEPRVGDIVWVLAVPQGDLFRAIVAEVITQTPAVTTVEFEGVLFEMADATWLVQDQRIEISPDTRFIGKPIVGADVEVRASLGAGAFPTAEVIRVVDADAETTLGVYVAAIFPSAGTSTVWDAVMFPPWAWADPVQATIHVDGNTLVDESRGVTGSGQWADVRGLSLGGSDYKADHIRIEQPVRVTISGAAAAVANGANEAGKADPSAGGPAAGRWWNVDGRQVWLSAGSAASAEAASAEAVTAAGAGGAATIHGLLLGNGVIWAEQVDPAPTGTQ